MAKQLKKVEECIAWAAQQGYCYAQDAADELTTVTGRVMHEDQNTGMYNTRSWSDQGKEPK